MANHCCSKSSPYGARVFMETNLRVKKLKNLLFNIALIIPWRVRISMMQLYWRRAHINGLCSRFCKWLFWNRNKWEFELYIDGIDYINLGSFVEYRLMR